MAIPINLNPSNEAEQILALEPVGACRGVEAVGYEALNETGQVDSSVTLCTLLNVTAPSGGIGIVGLLSEGIAEFNIGLAFIKRVSVDGGVVLLLQVAVELVPLVEIGIAHPSFIVSSVVGIEEAPEYYQLFNEYEESKVVIRMG
jgi:threonine dehydrogenase-like Zn-dependent dehydrogenase